MIFAEITFCPSINLKQPVMVLVLFLTYQLSCGMHYLILSVPLSLLVLKENQGPYFEKRLFFLIDISFKYCVFSHIPAYALHFSCKCYAWKILLLVANPKFKTKQTLKLISLPSQPRQRCGKSAIAKKSYFS